jgi:hypothetical protein
MVRIKGFLDFLCKDSIAGVLDLRLVNDWDEETWLKYTYINGHFRVEDSFVEFDLGDGLYSYSFNATDGESMYVITYKIDKSELPYEYYSEENKFR